MINEAFFSICRDAKPAKSSYVSLYVTVSYYGGPEEGGWWGSDNMLVAYHQCGNDIEAEHILAKVEELAQEMTDDAKRSFGRACLAQCEWLEARGLDSDSLPEVDGEESYFVVVEDTPGKHVTYGCRHYE